MSMKYLGDRFDVHTGGNDLRFPHHEDEIAQSEGAVGHPVVSTWVHGGFLRLTGQKIAKSTGNVIRAPELIERGLDPSRSAGSRSRRAIARRWTSRGRRWRRPTDGCGSSAATSREWGEAAAEIGPAGKDLDARFREAVSNDLDLPTAVRVVNDLDRSPDVPPDEKRALLASWDHVLGLDLDREAREGWEPSDGSGRWSGSGTRRARGRTTRGRTICATRSRTRASR